MEFILSTSRIRWLIQAYLTHALYYHFKVEVKTSCANTFVIDGERKLITNRNSPSMFYERSQGNNKCTWKLRAPAGTFVELQKFNYNHGRWIIHCGFHVDTINQMTCNCAKDDNPGFCFDEMKIRFGAKKEGEKFHGEGKLILKLEQHDEFYDNIATGCWHLCSYEITVIKLKGKNRYWSTII